MAGLVREPGRARDVADGIQAFDPGAAEFIGHHMAAVDLDPQGFQPQPLDIAEDADCRDHGVKLLRHGARGRFQMGDDLARRTVQFLHRGLFQDLHALLDKSLLGKGADFRILDRQNAVQHLDHRGIRAQGVEETGKFDADGA